jgi:hypothetical protein
MAVGQGRPYVRIDDWMRPAIAHGVRVATVAGIAIAVFGLIAVVFALRFDHRTKRERTATSQHQRDQNQQRQRDGDEYDPEPGG